ncbi:MAG TPA: UPF0158 family protein, partial [Mycobacterium sp.]|nr:UPF0158 family protein [Mycobacterium sp.]
AFKELRGAVYRSDGPTVVELVRGRLTDEVLQLAGDGLFTAISNGDEGSAELGGECAARLRQRRWDGDEELADQLEAALGHVATPMLRPLAVDLEQLGSVLEQDRTIGGGRIDRTTGELWPYGPMFDSLSDDDEDDDEDRWLYVEPVGSRDGYRDMERFIAVVDDPDIADRLRKAIDGRGAFRRFKDVLSRWPDLLQHHYQMSDERKRGRARSWLADKGYGARAR